MVVCVIIGDRYAFGLSSLIKDRVVGLSPNGGDAMTTFEVLTLMISFGTMLIALIAVVVAILNAKK